MSELSLSVKSHPEDVESSALDIDPAEVRFAAMNFLARREHTKHELLTKLKRRFPDDDALLRTQIQRLTDENLQSDERFAENFVLYRSDLGFGLMHIRQDMRQRGLSDLEIATAIEEAKIDWKAIAARVYHKKFGRLPALDIKEKAKRIRFMLYRGFSSENYQNLL
jgi:regulatory protein